ncbi:ATPase [Candidatus Nomurabacteria bacterium RIFCSPHIGHO2_02_FULL_37_45]|uniref:ATPase n=1 Tax=Candidatus Nomurabacteria bacterium RIFCSPHIGHO2_12_FULL_37_29 TaxID=1801759 RepID=A0A1F6WCE3_9BACT|nr:MAG: ATPase [Candidatus Nomurabacteria bacterium RIFCSPHIGHO2_01_FULL_37_110]OGI71444.1 MAG: ATPase [Candidatus Nomurabacteria bacterium RIFCSPHIGHO2_02_FULL_37_45]OGI79561.1 MAG: ATPase [Candidatus Nomurabacteria bacterium RIFCSPHIGHO2_12_FULL_37_29]OGI85445.1 MAG: ATPase [Candidatus Nomurabacteria bacterium RIFCSPLOWO2_01_FULL_37_49]
MVDVTTQIIIKRPQSRVFEYASNPDNAPEWYVNIKSVEWRTQKILAVGSKIAFKAKFLGRQLEYVYEIVDFVSGQKLVMRTADGPFLMETTYIWEAVNENTTHMTLRNRGNPTGFSKLFAPFMALAMKKANQKDLRKLKETLEK